MSGLQRQAEVLLDATQELAGAMRGEGRISIADAMETRNAAFAAFGDGVARSGDAAQAGAVREIVGRVLVLDAQISECARERRRSLRSELDTLEKHRSGVRRQRSSPTPQPAPRFVSRRI